MSTTGVTAEIPTTSAPEATRPYRFGGLSSIAAGVLFLTKYALDLSAGPPPASGGEFLARRAAQEPTLAITNEVLFFAAGFLIPAVIALYRFLARGDGVAAATGCGLIAALIPTIFVLDIVHGRLVYPVYGLRVDTPAAAELVLALYYGGLHAVGLLFALATVLLSFVMRRRFGLLITYLGIAAAVGDFIGAYPETFGSALILVSQVLFAAWFIALGSKLYGVRTQQGGRDELVVNG